MTNATQGGKFMKKPRDYDRAAQGEYHLGADVTANAFRVWHVLLSYADKDGSNARPGLEALMAESRLGSTAVKDALLELKDKGAIVKTGGGYRGHASQFVVLPLPAATAPAAHTPRFGARQFDRINSKLKDAHLAVLEASQWLDPEQERCRPGGTFHHGKVPPQSPERCRPGGPHQYQDQKSAEQQVAENVPTGPAASGCSPGTDEGLPRPSAGASSRPGQGGEPAGQLRVPIPAQDSQDDLSAQLTTTGHDNPDEPGSGTPDGQPTDQTRGLAMTGQQLMSEWLDSLADEPDSVAEHFDTAGQDQGSRGHLTGVPLPDRSRQATGFTRPLVRVTRIPGSNVVRIAPVRSAA